MVLGVIIKLLFALIAIIVLCVLFFLWLNIKNSKVDEGLLDDNFHPEELVSSYKIDTNHSKVDD